MRHRDNVSRITLIVGIILIVVIALNLGTCAYRNSLSSSMALDDSSVSSALVSAKNDEPLTRCLRASMGAVKTSVPATCCLTRGLPDNTVSLLNIPSNIAATYSDTDSKGTMLRDAPHIKDEGELVKQVSSLVGQDINHYVRITGEDFASLVDSLGGLNVNVEHTLMIQRWELQYSTCQQTLNGEQTLVYVSAKNYTDGYVSAPMFRIRCLLHLCRLLKTRAALISP